MHFTLTVKPFPVTIGVWCGAWDKESISSFVETLDPEPGPLEPPEENELGFCYANLKMSAVIWLPCEPETPKQIGILAHEAFHAAEIFAKSIGIKHSKESSEFYAYLIGYVVTETLRRCGKKTVD